MPSPAEILSGLTTIASQSVLLAYGWHMLLAAAIAAMILFGWRPTRRLGALLLCLPLASVSVLAWIYGNPFNGLLFALAAAILALIGSRLPSERAKTPCPGQKIIGALMVAFAWVYPHFLSGAWPTIFYASPLGLIPCPTLSLLVGFTMLARGFSSKAWSLSVAVLGIFYGLFGAFRLHVWIDLVLLAASLILLLQSTLGQKVVVKEAGPGQTT